MHVTTKLLQGGFLNLNKITNIAKLFMPFTHRAMLNYAHKADEAGKVGDSYTATFWQC